MSSPDIYARAAQFFSLAENAPFVENFSRMEDTTLFWQISPPLLVGDPAAYMPALAAAVRNRVRNRQDTDTLDILARYPLPSRLSPEIFSWYDTLVAAWEAHLGSYNSPERESAIRLALVRLDQCGMPEGMERPSRLPEWLAKATSTNRWLEVQGMSKSRLLIIGALAAWRPAPGVSTSPETLRDWVLFWEEERRLGGVITRGIAAKALLNVSAADLHAASIPTIPAGELLRDLARAIPAAAEKCDYLPLLNWQPTNEMSLPATELAKVVQSWLDVSRHATNFCCRVAWEELMDWNRTGALHTCGIDLLPILVEAIQTEKNGYRLWTMAQWMLDIQARPRTGTGRDVVLFRELEHQWQVRRASENVWEKAAGWLGSICLHQAGLASEPPKAFLNDYLSTLVPERNYETLFVLAHWAPVTDAPLSAHQQWQLGWQRWLENPRKSLHAIAALAFVRQAMELAAGDDEGNLVRQAALEAWRSKIDVTAVIHRIENIASRFYEVRDQLAAGNVPDFELILPPGHLTNRESRIENGELKMENVENREPMQKMANRPTIHQLSR